MKVWLVLIETSSNQEYIFATNRMRENVGASQLTQEIGTTMTLDAVARVTGARSGQYWAQRPGLDDKPRYPEQGSNETASEIDLDAKALREHLTCDDAPTIADGDECEVIVATSGKALLICKHEQAARHIVSEVTRNALVHAPGIRVTGALHGFDWTSESVHCAIVRAHRVHEEVAASVPHTAERFPQTPLVEPCRTSSAPAAGLAFDFAPGGAPREEGGRAQSRMSAAKQARATRWSKRLDKMLPPRSPRRFVGTASELESKFDALDWWGLVHADGTGFGQIFLNFHKYIGLATPESDCDPCKGSAESNREYCARLRSFSAALDEITQCAFVEALSVFPDDDKKARFDDDKKARFYPVLPLLLGGDDFWAICDGRYALPFAKRYLEGFEARSRNHPALEDILKRAYDSQHVAQKQLCASAGVAVVKPHFPFHHAHTLAESLIKSAKTTTKRKIPTAEGALPFPCSALDYHILYDASFTELAEIRAHLIVDGTLTALYARPFIVSERSIFERCEQSSREWAEAHLLRTLLDRTKSLQPVVDKPPVPTSQLMSVRAALFQGAGVASARLSLLLGRYGDGLKRLLEKPSEGTHSLWRVPLRVVPPDPEDPPLDEPRVETRFLDLVDSIEFWAGALEQSEQEASS